MKILVINGANLNRMHRRAPVFGTGETTLDELMSEVEKYAENRGINTVFFQSNHEGEIVDKLQEADGGFDGVIINPGPFTQYSHAIRATMASLPIPVIEVHLVNIYKTGESSLTGKGASCVIAGLGKDCYKLGIDACALAASN